MKNLFIKNGTIVTDSRSFKADIYVKDGKIHAIDEEIPYESQETKIIDASGQLVIPGGIDPHVHFDLPSPAGPSSDDFKSGSLAALAGGTTTIIDFVTPNRGQSYIEALKERKKIADGCHCDFSFHVSPTWWGPNSEREIEQCIKEEGISSFKIYMAYKDVIGLEDDQILKVMKAVKKYGGMVTMHCEEGDMVTSLRKKFIEEGHTSTAYHPLSRPALAEEKAIKKAVLMAEETGCTLYVVHVSTRGGVQTLHEAKSHDVKVYGESCPQYLLLDSKIYEFPFKRSAPFVMSPPLRSREHRDTLWDGISDGTIQSIGTDHCPFNLKGQKDRGINNFTQIPNGAGGVENRLSLLFTYGVLAGKINLHEWVSLCSTFPAKVFGLGNRKGQIKPGYDADLVIWDPHHKKIIQPENQHQNCDSNIFEGFPLVGEAKMVLRQGQLVYNSGKFQDLSKGEFIFRSLPENI